MNFYRTALQKYTNKYTMPKAEYTSTDPDFDANLLTTISQRKAHVEY
mgnify:CR=1